MPAEEQKIPEELVPKLEEFRKALEKGLEGKAPPIIFPFGILRKVPSAILQDIIAKTSFGLFDTTSLLHFLKNVLRKIAPAIESKDVNEILSVILASALTNFDKQAEPIKRVGEEIGIDEIISNVEDILQEKKEVPKKAIETLKKFGISSLNDLYKVSARQDAHTVLSAILASSDKDKFAELLEEYIKKGEDEKYLIAKKTFESIAKKFGIDIGDAYKIKDGKILGNYELISKIRNKIIEKMKDAIKELENYKEWKEVIDFYLSL